MRYTKEDAIDAVTWLKLEQVAEMLAALEDDGEPTEPWIKVDIDEPADK